MIKKALLLITIIQLNQAMCSNKPTNQETTRAMNTAIGASSVFAISTLIKDVFGCCQGPIGNLITCGVIAAVAFKASTKPLITPTKQSFTEAAPEQNKMNDWGGERTITTYNPSYSKKDR